MYSMPFGDFKLPGIVDLQLIVPAVNNILYSIHCEGCFSDVCRYDALPGSMRGTFEDLSKGRKTNVCEKKRETEAGI